MAGRTGDRQQAPPAKPPEKPGEKAAGNGGRDSPGGGTGGAVDHRREHGRRPCRERRRPCRIAAPRGFMRAVSGLYQVYLRPPYSPPRPHARAARHPCKIYSQHHRHSRPTASTGHTSHTSATSTEGTAEQHRATSTTRQPTPTAPQPALANTTDSQHHTRPGGPERRRRRPARRPPPDRTGGP